MHEAYNKKQAVFYAKTVESTCHVKVNCLKMPHTHICILYMTKNLIQLTKFSTQKIISFLLNLKQISVTYLVKNISLSLHADQG